jgi:hypothetical protein
MTKRGKNLIVLAGAVVLGLTVVSASKADLPLEAQCAAENRDVYVNTKNVTPEWQAFLTTQFAMASPPPINVIQSNFTNSPMGCPATGIWTGLPAISKKSCGVTFPNATYGGTSINYGGTNPTNPAMYTKRGCQMKKAGGPAKSPG